MQLTPKYFIKPMLNNSTIIVYVILPTTAFDILS